MDVAAAGGDALGQPGDDAHGVLAIFDAVAVTSSVEEEGPAQMERWKNGDEGGEEGRERGTYGALEEMDAEEVAGGHGGGDRPPRHGQHLCRRSVGRSIDLSFPDEHEQVDAMGWEWGDHRRRRADEMSRRRA